MSFFAPICTTEEQWNELLIWRRKDEKRVVFTNGCFDILHCGHVEYLAAARGMGDALVVGLNSDASVRRLKGPNRPINDFESRAKVLAALRSVDAIVGFDEDTPIRLIEAIRPEVLVKGADYDPDQIVGADLVRSYGGRVETVALTLGHSTTAMIQRIRMDL
ncbi:MAG: D-glycero-beta-D-manno-heptose 1-phosphate adenylyltransferase [Bacteroidia bacterium]|nr:D-glycero-beta-D-manno-heptose 1-phosphate adenylyltransferase [Bacteroidia bacterium]